MIDDLALDGDSGVPGILEIVEKSVTQKVRTYRLVKNEAINKQPGKLRLRSISLGRRIRMVGGLSKL